MRVRAITFDVYGTLLEDARAPLVALCHQIVQEVGLGMTAEELLSMWEEGFYALLEGRFMGMEEANLLSLDRLFGRLGVRADAKRYVHQLVEEWSRRPPYPEVHGVLDRLAGCPKALVTNADDGFLRRALERGGLRFDVVVTSEAVRAYKPDAAPFLTALQKLGLRPGEVLHVGDSLREDVAGARGAGMRTAWVNRSGTRPEDLGQRPDIVVRDLSRLLDALPQDYEPRRP